MRVKHTIRSPKGGTTTVELTPLKAIKAECSECMAWETHPKECTAKLCPLFPFRGKSMIAHKINYSNSHKGFFRKKDPSNNGGK